MSLLVVALGAAQKVTGGAPRLFIFFNLFLAWIPLLLALTLADRHPRQPVLWWLVLGTWLLFLPNSPYVLTDVLHLRWTGSPPSWRFTIQILTLAVTGLLLGMVSLQLVHAELRRRWGRGRAGGPSWDRSGWRRSECRSAASGVGTVGTPCLRPKLLIGDIVDRILVPQQHPVGSFTASAMGVLLLMSTCSCTHLPEVRSTSPMLRPRRRWRSPRPRQSTRGRPQSSRADSRTGFRVCRADQPSRRLPGTRVWTTARLEIAQSAHPTAAWNGTVSAIRKAGCDGAPTSLSHRSRSWARSTAFNGSSTCSMAFAGARRTAPQPCGPPR